MAISKTDCLLLLSEIQNEKGINCKDLMRELLTAGVPTLNILKFINNERPLDVTAFYEKLRKSYNNKKSKLYINIVRENNEDIKEVLTTLASLNLQILLYCKNVEDTIIFLKHCRFEDINKCLYNYAKTQDLIPCIKLLELIKADLKVLEYSNGRDTQDEKVQ